MVGDGGVPGVGVGVGGGAGKQGEKKLWRNLPPPSSAPPLPLPQPQACPLPQPHSGAQIKEKPEQGMFVVPPPVKDSVATVTGTLHLLESRWSVSNRQHMLRKP